MSTSEDRVGEIRTRLDKVDRRWPWEVFHAASGALKRGWLYAIKAGTKIATIAPNAEGADEHLAEFIAHAPDDITYLLSELGRWKAKWIEDTTDLEAERDALREENERLREAALAFFAPDAPVRYDDLGPLLVNLRCALSPKNPEDPLTERTE